MAISREEIDQIATAVATQVLKSIKVYASEYHPPENIQQGLQHSMGEELTASMWYQLRAKDAEARGDIKTAFLYRHIADEENVHYIEFNKRLTEITL
jgi:rubrerythrin